MGPSTQARRRGKDGTLKPAASSKVASAGFASGPAEPRAVPTATPADPGQQVAFCATLALLFFYLTTAHELLTRTLHLNVYPLYLFGIPAYLGLALSGGIGRALRERPVKFWTAFCIWAAIGIPFSTWKGSSAHLLFYYLKTFYPLLFLLAGLPVSWRQCKMLMYVAAASAAVFVFVAGAFRAIDVAGRAGLEFGSIQNSNDLAAVLILLLPFLLWFVFGSAPLLFRGAALPITLFGLFQVVHTGSRGGLLALAVAAVFYLWRATGRQRAAFLCLAPVAVVFVLTLVPHATLVRIATFSTPERISDVYTAGIIESTANRKILLRKSIEYTFQFPVFGVGLGQFMNYEGQHNILPGMTRGLWHVTHNAYTQVSSECGIPAFLFFIAAIVSSFLVQNRLYREARTRPDCQDIRATAFCIMLSMVGFCVAIFFLSLAYSCYLPALSGMAVAVARTARCEMTARADATGAAPVSAVASPGARWHAAAAR